VEHAGEGWRPFAVPKATALHGVRIVLHAALIGHVAYQRAIFYFFKFLSFMFLFFLRNSLQLVEWRILMSNRR
jgi:hypothetical protein